MSLDLTSFLLNRCQVGVNWPRHEADHQPWSAAKVNNEWSYLPTCFHEQFYILIKYTKIPLIQHEIICHGGGIIPRLEVLLITRNKLHQWNRQIPWTCSNGLQECLYIKCCGISRPNSPTSSTSLAVKSPENTEEYPDNSEPATAGDIQMEYSSD